MESLFTNVPIKGTVEIILRRIYQDRVVSTNLRKRTLEKLILDTFTKTAFLFNSKFYQQKDGVSMGSSLGPVLASIIMTELEDVITKPLIADDTIKFYSPLVDDTNSNHSKPWIIQIIQNPASEKCSFKQFSDNFLP